MLLGFVTVNASNVTPTPEVVVTSLDAEKFSLLVENQKSNSKIQIKDSRGVVLYTSVIKKGEKSKKIYDLSMLPKGTYYLKVVNRVRTKIYSVSDTNIKLVINSHNSTLKMQKEALAIL